MYYTYIKIIVFLLGVLLRWFSTKKREEKTEQQKQT
jgi:hypothetical protein